jgi:hypothetical protein
MSETELNQATLDFVQLMTKSVSMERISAELILDTNVAAELYSIGDLLLVIVLDSEGLIEVPQSQKFRYRQYRIKHSLILAWWLSRTSIPAAMLGAEHIQLVVDKLAPVENILSFQMTTAFVHIVRDLVLGSWHLGALIDVDHYKLKSNADDEILRIAKEDNTPVITWEGYEEDGTFSTRTRSLRNRCRSAGVYVATPAEWLVHNGVDIPTEAQNFIRACDHASWAAQWEGVLDGRKHIDLLIGFYRLVLFGESIQPIRHYYGRWP